MRKRNNLTKALLVIFMTAAMLVQTPVYAEETVSPDYERVYASYGERVESYVYQVDIVGTSVDVVITSEGKAHTYTDTNLREGPGIETRSLIVLPTDAQVLVWGFHSSWQGERERGDCKHGSEPSDGNGKGAWDCAG